MNFELITLWECTKCKKRYEEKPNKCSCHKKYAKGNIFGPFQLLEDKNASPEVEVVCRLCNMTRKVHYTNLERQKSCGCVPNHIKIVGVHAQSVMIDCKRCGHTKKVALPVFEYCCDKEN